MALLEARRSRLSCENMNTCPCAPCHVRLRPLHSYRVRLAAAVLQAEHVAHGLRATWRGGVEGRGAGAGQPAPQEKKRASSSARAPSHAYVAVTGSGTHLVHAHEYECGGAVRVELARVSQPQPLQLPPQRHQAERVLRAIHTRVSYTTRPNPQQDRKSSVAATDRVGGAMGGLPRVPQGSPTPARPRARRAQLSPARSTALSTT